MEEELVSGTFFLSYACSCYTPAILVLHARGTCCLGGKEHLVTSLPSLLYNTPWKVWRTRLQLSVLMFILVSGGTMPF